MRPELLRHSGRAWTALTGLFAVLLFVSLLFFSRVTYSIGGFGFRLLLNDAAIIVSWSGDSSWGVPHAVEFEWRDHLPDFHVTPAIRSGLGGPVNTTAAFRGMRPMFREIIVPLWIPLVICAVFMAVCVRRSRRRNAESCTSCGYLLRGLNDTITRCPECGMKRPSSPATDTSESRT